MTQQRFTQEQAGEAGDNASSWALLRPLAVGVGAGLCMLSPVDPVMELRLDLRVRERKWCSPGLHSE